jgi:hypothetical protein
MSARRDERPRPFGITFEEAAIAGEAPPRAEYDEERELWMTTDSEGRRIPLLSLSALPGTHTITRVRSEADDDDPTERSFHLGTQTGTAARAEQTDQDRPPRPPFAGTQTQTEVRAEQTDKDAGITFLSVTSTQTMVSSEQADDDRGLLFG